MPKKKKVATEEEMPVQEKSEKSFQLSDALSAPEKVKRDFVGTMFRDGRDILRTTAEELTQSWRAVRLGRFGVVKSAAWNDDKAWADLLDHLKLLVANPPDVMVKLGFELFSGGRNIDFLVDWKKSQTAVDGSVVLLRSKVSTGPCLVLAAKEKYIEGFKVEGIDYACAARLVLIATPT